MAESHRMTAEEAVAKLMSDEHADFLRESLRWMVEQLMDAEVSELIGAARGERTPRAPDPAGTTTAPAPRP